MGDGLARRHMSGRGGFSKNMVCGGRGGGGRGGREADAAVGHGAAVCGGRRAASGNSSRGVEVGAEWMADVEGRRWTQAARRAPRPSGMRLWCTQSLFEGTIWGKASARDRFRIRTTGLGGGKAAVNCWESKPGDGRQGWLGLQRRGSAGDDRWRVRGATGHLGA